MRRSSSSTALLLLIASAVLPSGIRGAGDPAETRGNGEPIMAEAAVSSEKLVPAGGSMKLSYSSCTVEGNVIALTFDDGPHAQNTPRLLDMLKQAGVKATFFVVGQNAAQYPDILKRIVAEGHEIANHSYTHPVLASLSEFSVNDQLDKTREAVFQATGVTMKLLRPPYGALSEPQRRKAYADFGYRTILWDVDPEDWKYRDAARVEKEIVGRTRAGSIILTHDIHKSTVDAMPSTIEALLAKGFKFVTVSELLALDKPAAPKAPAPVAAAAKPVSKTPAEPPQKREKSEAPDKPEKTKTLPAKETSSKETASKAKASASAEDTAPSSQNSSAGSSKPKALTQEELRKKWLNSSN